MKRLILFDAEAASALRSPRHPKHRRMLAIIHETGARNRRLEQVDLAVPTSVRVEAGWGRTAPEWAFANQFPVDDAILDRRSANVAAGVRAAHGLTVADAHLGASARLSDADRVIVVTSDPGDIRMATGDGPLPS